MDSVERNYSFDVYFLKTRPAPVLTDLDLSRVCFPFSLCPALSCVCVFLLYCGGDVVGFYI